MSDKRKTRKYNKIVSELLYYRIELQHLNSIMLEAHLDFEAYYKEFCKKREIDLGKLQEENKENIDKLTSERDTQKFKKNLPTIEGKRLLSKIYKSIALVIHPDKLITSNYDETEKKQKEEEFKTAASAAENNDWGELLEISEDLGLKVEINDALLSEIDREIDFLKRRIQNEQTTYSWILYQAPTSDEKDIVVKQFLKRMFNLEIT